MTDSSHRSQNDAKAAAQHLYEMGCGMLTNERGMDAVDCFRTALQAYPGHPAILNNLGQAYQLLNQWDEAEKAYFESVNAQDSYPAPKYNLARLYQFRGRLEEAIDLYRRYLAQESEDGEAYFNLGLIYAAKNMGEESNTCFAQAVTYLGFDDLESATNSGIAHFYLGNLEKADRILTQVVETDTEYVPALYHLALTRLYQGDVSSAIQALKKVLTLDPEHPKAAANLGVAYNTAGQAEKAVEILAGIDEQHPDNPSVCINLGFAYQDSGDAERAADCFSRVLGLTGGSGELAESARQALDEIG